MRTYIIHVVLSGINGADEEREHEQICRSWGEAFQFVSDWIDQTGVIARRVSIEQKEDVGEIKFKRVKNPK